MNDEQKNAFAQGFRAGLSLAQETCEGIYKKALSKVGDDDTPDTIGVVGAVSAILRCAQTIEALKESVVFSEED